MKTSVNEINETPSTHPESALHQIRDFAFYLADYDIVHLLDIGAHDEVY